MTPRNKILAGFTLIEVLIALAIISIAMTAIIKAMGQSIRGTQYLQNKGIALWVGQTVMNEIRLGIYVPERGVDQGKKEVLGKTWYYLASKSATPNEHIEKMSVTIYDHSPDKEDNGLIHLESYLYVTKKIV